MRYQATLALALLSTSSLGAVSLLGPDATIYSIDSTTAQGTSRLALTILAPDGSELVETVPGTDGPDVELNATLVFDDGKDTLIAVWEQRLHGVFSQLLLAERTPAGWSEPIELSGNPFASRGVLRVSVAAARPVVTTAGPVVVREQLVHMVWTDDAGPGRHVLYSPITLHDGVYGGDNALVRLSGFGAALPHELAQVADHPALARGSASGSVAIAYLDPETLAFERVALRSLPADLTTFADKARAEIIEIGLHQVPVSNRPAFADKARAEIIEIGATLHQSLKVYAADAIAAALLADPETDLIMLADKARAEIIEIGARALDTEPGRSGTFVTMALGDRGGDIELVRFEQMVTPTLPVGAEVVATYVSPSAKDVAIVWQTANEYGYLESTDGSWGEAKSLPVGHYSLDVTLALLQSRLSQR